jgi:hypothetical protein
LRPLVDNLARRAREALYAGYEEVTNSPVSRSAIQFYRMRAALQEYVKETAWRQIPHESAERLFNLILNENGNGQPS